MDKIFYLIPVFNAESTVLETLKSIDFYSQYEPKLIIVDDGSTDATYKKIYDYVNRKSLFDQIKLIYQENSGVASALNRGLQEIPNNVWIFRMDADDCDVFGRQEEMIKFMKFNSLDVAGSYIQEFGDSNSVRTYPATDSSIKLALSLDISPFAHPSMVFSPKTIEFLKYPYVDCEDLELFKALMKKDLKFGNFKYPMVLYRSHNAQITKSDKFKKDNQNVPKICDIFRIFWKIISVKNISIANKAWILRRALKLGMIFK